MIYKMNCPQCNSLMDMDDSQNHMFCPYCGTKVFNEGRGNLPATEGNNEANAATPAVETGNEPNLVVRYRSTLPQVRMIIAIGVIRKKVILSSGQAMRFKLPDGNNIIVLKIGRINYKRAVFIDSRRPPVVIFASWVGRANITIDQGYPAL